MSLTPKRKTISISTELFIKIEQIKKEKKHGSYGKTIEYLIGLEEEIVGLKKELDKERAEIKRLNSRAESTMDKILDRLPTGGVIVTNTSPSLPPSKLSTPPPPPKSDVEIKNAYNEFDSKKYENDKIALQEELAILSGGAVSPSQILKITKPKFRKTKVETVKEKEKRMKKHLKDVKMRKFRRHAVDLAEKSYVLKHAEKFKKEKEL